jgi:phospholipid/cholesterol/gamma-HCH transport system substrate-binding protein
MPLTSTDRRQLQFTALVAVIAVLVAGGLYIVMQAPARMITAYFTSATGVFESNAVRVLGVTVGDIVEVAPEGTQVRVEMRIDDPDLKLPADAKAVVVSPSLVTGRYIQLTPTWSGGPELQSGAVIPLERTAVPLGVDDLARTATELSDALGPRGLNSEGALSDALDVAADNLDGNGQALNDTIHNLGELSGTLADSREELFGTVKELQSFTSNLAKNDAEIREFNTRFEEVAGFLADERGDLHTAVRELSFALDDVAAFVRDNRELVHSNVDRLNDVTAAVVDQRKALAEVADVAPVALSNLTLVYNGSSGTLDARMLLNELTLPYPVLICELIRRGNPMPEDLPTELLNPGPACDALLGQLEQVPLPTIDEVITALQQGQLPPLPGLALPVVPGSSATAAIPTLPGVPGPLAGLPGLPGGQQPTGTQAPPTPPSGTQAPRSTSAPTTEPETTDPETTDSETTEPETTEPAEEDADRGGWFDWFGGDR